MLNNLKPKYKIFHCNNICVANDFTEICRYIYCALGNLYVTVKIRICKNIRKKIILV